MKMEITQCNNCPRNSFNPNLCPQFESIKCTYEDLEKDLLLAIEDFYKYDYELLDRHVYEVCIVGHIYHYFLTRFSDKYSNYHIDIEYNHNGDELKIYQPNNRSARPDLIIHRRNCNKNNLLYVEFKVLQNSHDRHDMDKIIAFVSDEYQYNYKYGVSILLNRDHVCMKWYQNRGKRCISNHRFEIHPNKNFAGMIK